MRYVTVSLACGLALLAGGYVSAVAGGKGTGDTAAAEMQLIRPSEDGSRFVRADTGRTFVPWGVNYDHDRDGRLIEDYWKKEWDTVRQDFKEIKDLGANVVRIHLQTGKFMSGPAEPNSEALDRLARLVDLAEEMGLYLDLTGLGCYHKQDVPEWYDEMNEKERWKVQARFWKAVARTCAHSDAVFCYDLMNEPVLPGKNKKKTEWLAGELNGNYFVQRISLDLKGRTRREVARRWVNTLASAIRKHDNRHMITVGAIAWVLVFPRAKPIFYSPEVAENLDFVAVHLYPRKNEVDDALEALKKYDIGKPLLIEETFPLRCSMGEMVEFIEGSRDVADGWISFYWGKTAEEYASESGMAAARKRKWLKCFKKMADSIR